MKILLSEETQKMSKGKVMKRNHIEPKLKGLSVRLQRLKPETIDRLLNADFFYLEAKIRGDCIHIGGSVFKSKKQSFDIQIKLSRNKLELVKPNIEDKIHEPMPIRTLRPKIKPVKATKMNIVSRDVKPKSLSKQSDDAWRIWKRDNINGPVLQQNEIVMAKLRGYFAWPALILSFVNKSRAKVKFFGCEQIGYVSTSEIVRFSDSVDVLTVLLERNNDRFTKAVREAECCPGILGSISILNRMKRTI